MVLMVDTTKVHIGKAITEELLRSGENTDGFLREEAPKFTGPEYFPLPVRLIVGLLFKTLGKKMFQKAAASWGCSVPLDEKVWET